MRIRPEALTTLGAKLAAAKIIPDGDHLFWTGPTTKDICRVGACRSCGKQISWPIKELPACPGPCSERYAALMKLREPNRHNEGHYCYYSPIAHECEYCLLIERLGMDTE